MRPKYSSSPVAVETSAGVRQTGYQQHVRAGHCRRLRPPRLWFPRLIHCYFAPIPVAYRIPTCTTHVCISYVICLLK